MFGAVEKTRTSTGFLPQPPPRCASTSSATTAGRPAKTPEIPSGACQPTGGGIPNRREHSKRHHLDPVTDTSPAARSRAGPPGTPLAGEVEWRHSDGPVPYLEAVQAMETRVEAILAGTAPELVWLLEHPALYTAGTSARPGDLREPTRLPVFPTGREIGRAHV